MKRTAYIVKVRCMYNGADTTKLLYLKAESEALDTMRRYVPKHERNGIRIIETRPATMDEMKAHAEACALI